MQAFTINSNGKAQNGIRVTKYAPTGAYQISLRDGRGNVRPVFVPLFKNAASQVVETPTGMAVEEVGVWFDPKNTRRAKLSQPKNDAWEQRRSLVSLWVYAPANTRIEFALGEDAQSKVLAAAFDYNRRGDQRQFVKLVAILREGETIVFTATPRGGKNRDPKVVATLYTNEDGLPAVVKGEREEVHQNMMDVLAEVSAT